MSFLTHHRAAAFALGVLLAACTFAAGERTPDVPKVATPGDFPQPSPSLTKRVTGLFDQLRHRGPGEDRTEIADRIVDCGPDALPLVIAELERRSRVTWPVMMYVLGAIGDPRAIPLLRRELTRQSGLTAMEALYALTLAGDDQALIDALRSENATIVFDGGDTGQAINFIAGALGPRAVDRLVQELPLRGQDARAAAMQALGTISDGRAVEPLMRWAKSPTGSDRKAAVAALGRIGDPRARPVVLAAFEDRDPQVKEAAAEAAGYLRDPKAVPALATLIAARQWPLARVRAIWSLGLIGGSAGAGPLNEALAHALDDDRGFLLQALGNTQHAAAIPMLARDAGGAQPEWALSGTQGLTRIAGDAAQDKLLEVCTKGLDHTAGLLAARNLIERRDPRAIPCVLQRLKEDIDIARTITGDTEDLLTGLALAAPESAAASLDELAEQVAAPPIQHQLRQTAQRIRMIREFGSDPARWIGLLDTGTPAESDFAVQRLGDLADSRAVEPLTRLLGRIDADRAWRIPAALGRIGSDRATSFLISLLVDDVYRVPSLQRARSEAARALARYSHSPHAAEALKTAYLAEKGRLFVPLIALAKIRGAAALPDLVELKTLLFKRRGEIQVSRHDRIAWAMRCLRNGIEIPLEEVKDER